MSNCLDQFHDSFAFKSFSKASNKKRKKVREKKKAGESISKKSSLFLSAGRPSITEQANQPTTRRRSESPRAHQSSALQQQVSRDHGSSCYQTTLEYLENNLKRGGRGLGPFHPGPNPSLNVMSPPRAYVLSYLQLFHRSSHSEGFEVYK